MNVGVLFSGGKDSCLACYRAMKEHKVKCLIIIESANPESYMFHTPNIGLAKLQAEAMGIPAVVRKTKGAKEEELKDLKLAVEEAKKRHKVGGIVSGAICSVYQKSRVDRICKELGLESIAPLWGQEQLGLLREFASAGFRALVVGVFAPPLDGKWLGREIDERAVQELGELRKKHGISPVGEGGEIETFVFDGPIFGKRVEIRRAEKRFAGTSGVYEIKEAALRGHSIGLALGSVLL